MNTIFVTCIFNGLHDTPYGGRHRDQMYRESLLSISKMGCDIVCFTSLAEVSELSSYFKNHWCVNITVKPFDLFGQNYHQPIMRIKQKYPDIYDMNEHLWKNRCPEIMWGKTRMLSQTIQENPNSDYVFWIDAGLSNSSVFPKKYFPRQEQGEEFYSERIFTNIFTRNLVKAAGEKIFVMIHDWPNNRPIPSNYNKTEYSMPYGAVVAGLFGGKSSTLINFCIEFETYIEKMLANEEIYPEESAYTGIVNDNQELFNCHWFKTFYHEDWVGFKYYTPGQRSFADVIEELANLK